MFASKLDPAANKIAERLLNLYGFEKYPEAADAYVFGDVVLLRQPVEATSLTHLPIDADEVIVASRHAAEAGRPSLTVHAPGKIDEGRLAVSSPDTILKTIRWLVRVRDEFGLPHEVSLEATHHGPCDLDVPVTFVEIGSRLEQWSDPVSGEAIARAIIGAAMDKGRFKHAIGLGGPHYAPRHTEVALKTDVAPGHIFPRYSNFDVRAIEAAVSRTAGGVELFVLDWKGLSAEQRSICTSAASNLGVKVVRAGELSAQPKV